MRSHRPDPVSSLRVRAILGAGDASDPQSAPPAGEAPMPTHDEVEQMLRRARRPALLTVPHPIRTARVQLSAVVVIAVLALSVALGALWAVRVLWADRPGQVLPAVEAVEPASVTFTSAGTSRGDAAGPSPPPPSAAGPLAAGPTNRQGAGSVAGAAAGSAGGARPVATGAGVIVVHVTGAVQRPGLVTLSPGARVADAVSAAGGPAAEADLDSVNLARLLTDSEQVHVAKVGEAPRAQPQVVGGAGTTASGGAPPAGAGGQPVDLNSADAAALDTLPGVGPVLAQRIIDWRSEHGRFSSVEELGEVSGIGDKLFATLRPLVAVG